MTYSDVDGRPSTEQRHRVNDLEVDGEATASVKRWARKIRYGPSRHQVGVYRPPKRGQTGRPAFPTIVLLHGGSWSWPYNRWVMCLLARDVTRRGWGLFNVDYRRVGHLGGGGGWPETFDDARTAIELITNDKLGMNVDPDRVVVVGHSAGGHLALIGSATANVSPALAVSMAGPTDLERMWSKGFQPVRDLTARAPESSRWSTTSPIHMLPLGTPILCVHGEADTTVHPSHSTAFVEAARSAGDTADVVLVPGETHKSALKPTSAIWAAVVHAILDRFELNTHV